MPRDAIQASSYLTTNIFDWCLKALLVLAPIIWLPNILQDKLQLLVFHYGVFCLFFLTCILGPKRNPTVLLGVFGLVAIAVSLLKNTLSLQMGFLNVVFGLVLCFSIISNAYDIKSILRTFKWLLWINIVFLFFQALGADMLYLGAYGDQALRCGVMGRRYDLGNFLAIISPILYSQTWLYGILILLAIALTKCYSAILGFFAGLAIYSLLKIKNKKIKYAIVALAIIAILASAFILYSEKGSNLKIRFLVWREVLRQTCLNPLIGHGFTGFNFNIDLHKFYGPYYSDFNMDTTYNEFFNLLFMFGLLPVFIIITSITMHYRGALKIIKDNKLSIVLLASIVAMVPPAFFHETWHIPRLVIPMLIILGLFEANYIDQKHKLQGGCDAIGKDKV